MSLGVDPGPCPVCGAAHHTCTGTDPLHVRSGVTINRGVAVVSQLPARDRSMAMDVQVYGDGPAGEPDGGEFAVEARGGSVTAASEGFEEQPSGVRVYGEGAPVAEAAAQAEEPVAEEKPAAKKPATKKPAAKRRPAAQNKARKSAETKAG